MSYPKLIGLVRKISTATQNGFIEWKKTEQDDVFQVSFADNSVRIGERGSRNDPEFNEFYLSIYNAEGDLVEDIGDEDGKDQDERSLLFRALKETYETARRQARGVDQVLDSILHDLDEKLPF